MALAADGSSAPRPTVYVHLHTDAKSATLERALAQKLPAVAVTVFGRFRDFEEAMAARPPDGVLALGICLAAFRVPAILQGVRANSDTEPYVLVSSGASIDGSR